MVIAHCAAALCLLCLSLGARPRIRTSHCTRNTTVPKTIDYYHSLRSSPSLTPPQSIPDRHHLAHHPRPTSLVPSNLIACLVLSCRPEPGLPDPARLLANTRRQRPSSLSPAPPCFPRLPWLPALTTIASQPNQPPNSSPGTEKRSNGAAAVAEAAAQAASTSLHCIGVALRSPARFQAIHPEPRLASPCWPTPSTSRAC